LEASEENRILVIIAAPWLPAHADQRGGARNQGLASITGDDMKRHMLISVLLAILLLIPANARADGLANIGHYTSGDGSSFDIATFSQGGETVGLLGISHKVSITFHKDEWQSIVAIWRKAHGTQSSSFQFIGTYKETGTTYSSLLTVAAGPGVQFTINDKAGTFTYVLPRSDYAGFAANVATVAASLK
jgi:hypothetical protein